VAAIRQVRALAEKGEGEYDMRQVMASFVGKLSYREMCTVLKEQRGWRQARDFFAWMKLQVGHCLDFSGKFIILAGFGHIWVFVNFWKSNICHFCLGIILLGGRVCEGLCNCCRYVFEVVGSLGELLPFGDNVTVVSNLLIEFICVNFFDPICIGFEIAASVSFLFFFCLVVGLCGVFDYSVVLFVSISPIEMQWFYSNGWS
jgi:hypothetical protein